MGLAPGHHGRGEHEADHGAQQLVVARVQRALHAWVTRRHGLQRHHGKQEQERPSGDDHRQGVIPLHHDALRAEPARNEARPHGHVQRHHA